MDLNGDNVITVAYELSSPSLQGSHYNVSIEDGWAIYSNYKAWRKVGDGRIEMPDYPDRAVLEGVVNALIHRNYMEIGSEVHIDMFDDRKVIDFSQYIESNRGTND